MNFRIIKLLGFVLYGLSLPLEAGDLWKSLFNGKDLTGWSVKCVPKDAGKEYWTVDRGSILVDTRGDRDHDYVWLVSDGEYADFKLRLKFQIYRGTSGNSGVQVRSRYDDKGRWLNGPQLDIHPATEMRAGLIYDETRGSQRWICPLLEPGNHKIPKEQTNPKVSLRYGEDEWNEMLIIAKGTRIQCLVNGELASDYKGAGLLDDANHKEHQVGMIGHIALQLHSKSLLKLRFKDIDIAVLTEPGQ